MKDKTKAHITCKCVMMRLGQPDPKCQFWDWDRIWSNIFPNPRGEHKLCLHTHTHKTSVNSLTLCIKACRRCTSHVSDILATKACRESSGSGIGFQPTLTCVPSCAVLSTFSFKLIQCQSNLCHGEPQALPNSVPPPLQRHEKGSRPIQACH